MPAKKADRRHAYWELHDFSTGRGLEIGPLHRTIVARDEADVRYVDVADQSGLRSHYANDSAVDPQLIPEIDYVLLREDGSTRTLPDATADGAPFDWVMASHVIEHVPDLIGWLGELAEITVDGGLLVLSIPDRRFCFDVNRPPTTVGQMLRAHRDRDTRPSVRAVYDYFSSVVDNTAADLWAGRTPDYSRKLHTLDEAVERVAAAEAGQYVDCHVWLFSPQSFVEQMHELRLIGRTAWMLEKIVETPARDLEFRVRMRRLPRGVDGRIFQPNEVTPTAARPDWLTPVEPSDLVAHLEEQALLLEKKLVDRRKSVAREREKRDEAEQSIRLLRRELKSLRIRRQWRAGMTVLSPLMAARQLRRQCARVGAAMRGCTKPNA